MLCHYLGATYGDHEEIHTSVSCDSAVRLKAARCKLPFAQGIKGAALVALRPDQSAAAIPPHGRPAPPPRAWHTHQHSHSLEFLCAWAPADVNIYLRANALTIHLVGMIFAAQTRRRQRIRRGQSWATSGRLKLHGRPIGNSAVQELFFLFIHYSHATYQIVARLCTVRFLSAVRTVAARCKLPFALRPGLSKEDIRQTKETTKEKTKRDKQRKSASSSLLIFRGPHEVRRGQEQWKSLPGA